MSGLETDQTNVYLQTAKHIWEIITRLEAGLQLNIGFTIRCVFAVFMSSAIIPPKVN